MTNPLLDEWHTPFELPPFDQIKDEHFAPALSIALKEARETVTRIAENPEPPSFENTIEALELSEEALGRVLSVFFTLTGTDANEKREALQREFSPLISAYASEVMMNAKLFARVEHLWVNLEGLNLSQEQERVLMLTRRSFVRAGAQLEGESRERLSEIRSRLASLGTRFSQNVLADERQWSMQLSEAQLSGLPDFVIAAAREAGKEKGVDGAAITLSRSLIVPFLQFSSHRDLREKAWRAWTARGSNAGDTDNRGIISEILALRSERARLLGYDDFATYKLETQMAKTPGAVRDLLMQVWKPALQSANAEAAQLQAMMADDRVSGPLELWDWRYYSEKRRRLVHDLDEAELKPYLQLDRLIDAVFTCARKLFGIEATPIHDVSLNHPDARAWEMTRNGEHLAVFIGDYFSRPSKRSGAWCAALRSQRKLGGEVRPVVENVCNFARPSEGEPALLSYDDARTLFHEFGHALHHMLSDVTFESISGTSVAGDFVELPSQLLEHWLKVPDLLAEYAIHAETAEPMPEDLLNRLLEASNYDVAFETVEYIASAMVDLEFHTGDPPHDPVQRQSEILADLRMPYAIPMRHAAPHFIHVFAGDGYSASYYGYMWSEMMDADAFAAFEETGDVFDGETASRLERHILSVGGFDEPEVLYKAFRGRMPGPDALLKGRGLAA